MSVFKSNMSVFKSNANMLPFNHTEIMFLYFLSGCFCLISCDLSEREKDEEKFNKRIKIQYLPG